MIDIKERKVAFVLEYEKLCSRYGFHIGACSCCDGPHVFETGNVKEGCHFTLDKHVKHLIREVIE